MADISRPVCEQLARIGIDCAQPVLSVTIWHLIVIAVLAPVVGTLVHIIFRYRDIGREKWKQAFSLVSHSNGAVNYPNTLMLHSHRMRDMLEVPNLENASVKQTARELNDTFDGKFFLVEFRENGNRLFRKELKLRAGWKNLGQRQFRSDPDTLKLLKSRSASDEDDDTAANEGAVGQFDVFVRQITPWDVRHWLHHPNREIRIGLWVAMFATFLEFGPDAARLLKALFSTPVG